MLSISQRGASLFNHEIRVSYHLPACWLYDCAFNSSSTSQKTFYKDKQIFSQRIEQSNFMVWPDNERIYKFNLEFVNKSGVSLDGFDMTSLCKRKVIYFGWIVHRLHYLLH
jgi:hypothetical protein